MREAHNRGRPSRVVIVDEAERSGEQPNPVLSSISSGTPNAEDATITWDTDIAADSTVFWGLTAAYAGATSPIFDPAQVTSHSVQITGLVTATVYHYAVRSRSTATGGYSTSADDTFTTA